MKRARLMLMLLVVLALVAAACTSSSDETTTTAAGDETTTTATAQTAETTTTAAAAETTTTAAATEPAGTSDVTLKFWTTETEPERLQKTQANIENFTAESGIAVDLTSVEEDLLPQLMITNAASGTLPDVVFHPLDFTVGWADAGILDQDAAAAVIDKLGADNVDSMVESFLQSGRDQHSLLLEAIDRNALTSVENIAHKLRGAAGNFGLYF